MLHDRFPFESLVHDGAGPGLRSDLGRLLASALTVLATSACGPSDGGPYDGDYGQCDPDDVDAMALVVVRAIVTFEGDLAFSDAVIGHSKVEQGDDALVCVEVGEGAPACMGNADAWEDGVLYGADAVEDGWEGYWRSSIECGPMELDARCCFTVEFSEYEKKGEIGRPFLVQRRQRQADTRASDTWCAATRPASVPDAVRPALVDHWTQAAQAEHASVASFARFAMVLMHHGAPADLVAEAHRAALDEVRHAELCYGLASAYAGEPLGPGPLDVSGALSGELALPRVVETLVAEGCVGETLAALEAAETARHAKDPVVRAALQGIADDEARHAALAWRTLAWLVETHPGLRDIARVALLSRPQAVSDHAPGLADHGCLSRDDVARIREVGLARVIAPLGRQVLGGGRGVAGTVEGVAAGTA